MSKENLPQFRAVARRQFLASSVFLVLVSVMVFVLYAQDRQQEWRLRKEQAAHRLELAYELITRDLTRARSDILYVASQESIRNFSSRDVASRRVVESEFRSFLQFKRTWQQIRLVNPRGHETVRVDARGDELQVIPESDLQDKKDRYYVRESLRLRTGEVFVSEFDLNQERGVIERPLNPVIRFVTPVASEQGDLLQLLVANYQGVSLLQELSRISFPGKTFLVRGDGQYLLGPTPGDAWGWLLDHRESFDRQFAAAWDQRQALLEECLLTPSGAFAFRKINLQRFGQSPDNDSQQSGNNLLVVSWLPANKVFETSNQLLSRLLLLASVILLPLFLLTRYWAVASVRREQQNRLILTSERKLRDLSSRLVKIQEDERRAISREIHDQLGQQATAINLDLKMANREAKSGKVRSQLKRAIDESEQLLETLHDFATRVRPVELDDLGLHDAVHSHLWEFQNRTGIGFVLDSNVQDIKLPSVIAENVYRLVQEALNNVLKHANATQVEVSIELKPATQHPVLEVKVRDDGIGSAGASESQNGLEVRPGLGILGMRERVELLGGTIDLRSETNHGTSIEVLVPINESLDDTPQGK